MNNIVDIIYSKNERFPQISINGEKISRYMELADLIFDDIFNWADRFFESMDDELCENYTVHLTGHPFHNLALKAAQAQSQYCSGIRFTPIAYKIPMAEKLSFVSTLNHRYHLGVRQVDQTVHFCTNDPERFHSLVPCSDQPENYYITADNQLPANGAKFCVILSEQLRFEKRQGITIVYAPSHQLLALVDYLNLYHLHLDFIAKVYAAANDFALNPEDRLMLEAYFMEEYRVYVSPLPETMNTGDHFQLSYKYYPQYFEDPDVRISTNNPAVLFTSESMLTAHSAGTATIALTDKFGTNHGTYQINVEHHIYVSNISIVLSATSLRINETLRFKCLLSPMDAEDIQSVRYTVSDPSVAAITGPNEIYGIAAGRVKVTVSTSRISKSFYLSVLPAAKDVLLPETSLSIPLNADAYIHCSVVPSNASPMPTVSWRSSDPRVIKVTEAKDYYCWISSIESGSATLTCMLNGTEISKSMQVEVQRSGGCYVATAVYGSYDCPQVWILRRYRDQFLASHGWGRTFIKLYYAVSPTVVKLFGKTNWFNRLWRGVLDNKIRKLKDSGYEDTPYND